MGVSSISRPDVICYDLLGHSPNEGKFINLRFSWLKSNFEHLASTTNEWEVMQAVRGYIMHLIGGVLMPDANCNMVHLMYLPLLSNLHNTRSYSWGSAVLAMLYRKLYRRTDPFAMDIGRCLILLQSWALYQISFMTSKLWWLFPRLPTSTQTHGALAHPLSIFRQWSGIMAIEYSSSSLHTVHPDTASTIGGDPWD
ncbi:hypothetical protein PVK06_029986 [Gossypium arboreum]|uniref:Aminotransferase-like plant mobile domain-containing protein n=1 Tax=Gossypium arboreum TaxID=29729 RepID=A0ABR0NM95_GOSAR|nr:hypothetical protein PVK06_029986 [Gossypium arboreum]